MSRHPGTKTDTEPLELWEYKLIISNMKEDHWRVFYQLLWDTGIRVSEALAICKKDLVEDGVWITREKRADKLREILPVNTELITELTQVANKKKDAHLFPYTKQAAWLALKQAVRATGCRETIHPHLFRHGFGHRAYAATKDILLVQRMMGHRSTSSTEGYSKPTMAEVREAFRNINREK